jgi:hypothetical protein
MNVRYVLEGSVRKAGGRVRITAQPIEATTGAHLWADRFEGSLEVVFDLQDNVASSIAAVIEPTVQVAEMRLSAARPTSDLTAYDLYLRARSIGSSYEKDHLAQALDLLEQAIAREPRYGLALAQAAPYRVDLENYDWVDDREGEENRQAAIELSRQAVAFAPDEGPELDQGDTEAKPRPAPRASRIRLIAAIANAPPIIAAHEMADTGLSAGTGRGTRRPSLLRVTDELSMWLSNRLSATAAAK